MVQSEGGFNAGITLTESNYDVWSQLMEMHIAEREKSSYIRGKKAPPAESENGYEKWYAENQKVKRWLLMSMSPDIMKRYLRLPTAQEIWNALSKAFYDGSDELRVFSLNQKVFATRQSGKTLSEYYGELTKIFHELDHHDTIIMKDADDIAAYKKSIERLRVHFFLTALDGAFEQVQGDILRKDPILDLEECYALVRQETVRHTTLKGECDTSDISAMVAQRLKTSNSNANPVDKSSLKCTHYMMYFSSESELQRKNHQEIQTLTYDHQFEFINQEVGELDLGGMNLESTGSALSNTEEMIEEGKDSMTQSSSLSEQHGSEEALADIPNQSSSIEDILNLESESSRKQLPYPHTRGIPKPTYEPELSISLVSSCITLVSNI
ncbi:hypothetical protein ACOSQ3_002131 [Xanthoceras sorbifolium]